MKKLVLFIIMLLFAPASSYAAFGSCGACDGEILKQLVKNGAGDTQAQKLVSEMMKQAAVYEAQQAHIRDGLIQKNEIIRTHPELSPLTCGIATANISIPAIRDTNLRVVSDIIYLITNGISQDNFTGTPVDETKHLKVLCIMGADASDTCTKPFVRKLAGSYKNRWLAITDKDSIACDPEHIESYLQSVAAADPKGDMPKPNKEDLDCLGAVYALAEQFEEARRYPTEEEGRLQEALNMQTQMNDTYARAWENMGNLLAAFVARVSVPESLVGGDGCWKGLKGSASEKGLKEFLIDRYGGSTTRTSYPPYGMPEKNYCLSERQIEKGFEMMKNAYLAEDIGGDSTEKLLQANVAVSVNSAMEDMVTRASIMNSTTSAPSGENFDVTSPNRRVLPNGSAPTPPATSDNSHELLSAIKQLTAAVERLGAGKEGFGGKVQEVRLKGMKNAPSEKTSEKSGAPVSTPIIPTPHLKDALKELGVKLSSGN